MIKTHRLELVESRSGRVCIRESATNDGVYNITIRSPITEDRLMDRAVGSFHITELESLFDALGELVNYQQAGAS